MLRLGTATADITPRDNIDLSGYLLRTNPSTSRHDPLKVRWISLCDENCHCALIGSADVLSFSRQTFRTIREQVLSEVPGGYAHIGLSTTHTHSAPAVVRLRHCGQKSPKYVTRLKHEVAHSAVQSAQSQKPISRVRMATTHADLCINRRQGEDGPCDTELQVIAFDYADGTPAATIVNYACHPVTLGHTNRGVSADYPGYLCAAIEARTGGTCIFLNGACGDINPRDAHHDEPSATKKMGEALADAALSALDTATELSDHDLNWYRQTVKLPVHMPKSLAEVNSRLDALEQRFGVSRQLFSSRVERDRRLLETGRYPRSVTIELSLLTIGHDLAILFVPGELFSSIGLRAKAMAAPRRLLISGFSNGSVGYLSDRQAYAEGGYEPLFANFFYDFPEFNPALEDHLLAGVQALLNAAAVPAHISRND